MSVYVSGCVWKHSQAKGSDLLVLLAIADISGDDGIARPEWDTSVAKLAAKTRLSERAVQYCIRALEGIGELVVGKPNGKFRANTYQILLDRNRGLFDGPAAVDKTASQPVDISIEDPAMGATGCTVGCNPASKGVQPVAPDPSVRLHVKSRVPPRGRKSPVDKAGAEQTAAERVAEWFKRGLSKNLTDWAALHGWSPFIGLHLETFRDYLTKNPDYAVKHKDLDACFRSCVRADWERVRANAQRDARFGRGVDLANWWKSSDGIKAKGFALGIPYDAATFRMKFVERVPMAADGRQWDAEEIARYGWIEYEVTVLDAVVEREGWGAWVDPAVRPNEFRFVCKRRRARGAQVPTEPEREAA